jgi:hypothetical protein
MHVSWSLEPCGAKGGSRSLDLQHPVIGAGLSETCVSIGSAALAGKASALAHHASDFSLLGEFNRIVDVDAKVSHGALKLRMP